MDVEGALDKEKNLERKVKILFKKKQNSSFSS